MTSGEASAKDMADKAATGQQPAEASTSTPQGHSALEIDDKCQVRWRGDGEKTLLAVVVERRPMNHRKRQKTKSNSKGDSKNVAVDITTLKADEIEYYVHYENHDR